MGVALVHFFNVLMLYQGILSGARSALPMGVAPEAIVEKEVLFRE
jgi:hypothetical protein